MSAKKSIPVGTRFASLIVVRSAEPKDWKSRSVCQCDCGIETTVYNNSLLNGNTGSCGCMGSRYNRPIKHGLSNTEIWNIWKNMMQRCHNQKAPAFKNYGGRGITVCDRWQTFENFVADVGQRPVGLTLERKNNELGYSPDNCKWATRREQRLNQRPRRLGIKHLSESSVREIRLRYSSGTVTQAQLAADFAVSTTCINSILAFKRWKHVV